MWPGAVWGITGSVGGVALAVEGLAEAVGDVASAVGVALVDFIYDIDIFLQL